MTEISKVEAMNGFALKEWQFVNSANKRDSLRDGLGPDVPIYGPEASPNMDKPDFSQMDAFVEFKEKESADSFEDSKRVNGKPAGGKRPSFERNTIEAELIRGQLGLPSQGPSFDFVFRCPCLRELREAHVLGPRRCCCYREVPLHNGALPRPIPLGILFSQTR